MSQMFENTMKNHTEMSLGGHWLNMEPFGMTFGTLRLHLDPIWCILGAFLVSLGVILDTPGSISKRLGHLNDPPECHFDSKGRLLKIFIEF